MDAISTIECLIDNGTISEEKGNELIKILRPFTDSAEAIKILAALQLENTQEIIDAINAANPSEPEVQTSLFEANAARTFPVIPGRSYVLSFKGDFGSGHFDCTMNNGPGGSHEPIINGSGLVDTGSGVEINPFEPTSDEFGVELAGATDPSVLMTLTMKL